ncbi:hypothetical protein L195_g013479, partial [Trifolium pratense]
REGMGLEWAFMNPVRKQLGRILSDFWLAAWAEPRPPSKPGQLPELWPNFLVFLGVSLGQNGDFLFQTEISRDCGGNNPELREEMEKQFVDLLTEELKLQESVSEAHTRHMNITLAEAKRVGSQYQREADKCVAATETCEQAREQAEAKLTKERKITLVWEKRARQMGWEGE